MDGYLTLDEAYLMHHGVKGMKWGVRKQRSNLGVGRRALMGVGKAATHIPGMKTAMNASFKRQGLKQPFKTKESALTKAGKNLTKTTAAKVGQKVGKKINNFYSTPESVQRKKLSDSSVKLMKSGGKMAVAGTLTAIGSRTLGGALTTVGMGRAALGSAGYIVGNVGITAKGAIKGIAQNKGSSFKQRMVEKHGAADADVEGDPMNYSWNRKAAAKNKGSSFKQRMVEKHGAADADVEGDPMNYSWNRKAAAKKRK